METTVSKYHEKILENSNNIKANVDDLEQLKKRFASNKQEIDELRNVQGDQEKKLTSNEADVKENRDHLRHVDDTLDGLKNMNEDFKKSTLAIQEEIKEASVLTSKIQSQVSEQEQKFGDDNTKLLSLVKDQLADIENQQGVATQKITELDQGTQGLLGKFLDFEKSFKDELTNLSPLIKKNEENIKNIDDSLDGLFKAISDSREGSKVTSVEIKSLTEKLSSTTESLTKSINETKEMHSKIVQQVSDMDSGNQQLLEKILAVEQDMDDKVQGINNNSGNLGGRVSSLEDGFKDSVKTIVQLQESVAIQVETIQKVESDRKTAESKAKEDMESKLQSSVLIIDQRVDSIETSVQKTADVVADQSNLLKEHTEAINANMSTVTSASNKISGVENNLSVLSQQLEANSSDIEKLNKGNTDLIDVNKDLAEKVKSNRDHLESVDDSLNGLKVESKHLLEKQKTSEGEIEKISSLTSSIENKVREQERKFDEQSSSNYSVFTEQLRDLENQQGVSAQKIGELDQGTQALHEKLLDVEKKTDEKLQTLEESDKDLLKSLSSISSEMVQGNEGLKQFLEAQIQSQTERVDNLAGKLDNNKTHIEELETRVKRSEVNIKNIDDTLDGLQSSLDKHSEAHEEAVKTISDININLNNTQIQIKDQEKTIMDKSHSDISVVKKQLEDLGNSFHEVSQKSKELETGMTTLQENNESNSKQISDKITSVEKDFEKKLLDANNSSDEVMAKLNELDITNKENTKGIVSLQESMSLQVENIHKVEMERQSSAAQDKQDIEEKVSNILGEINVRVSSLESTSESTSNSVASQSNLLKEHTEAINSNMSSISSASNKIAGLEKELGELSGQVSSHAKEIEMLKEQKISQETWDNVIEEKLKKTDEHFKNLNDSLDGLSKTVASNHLDSAEKLKQISSTSESIQIQVREQEHKLVEQSNNVFNVIKEQIKDIENLQGVATQKMSELDQGMQGSLEKILSVEQALGEQMSSLESADKDLALKLASMSEEVTTSRKLIKEDFDLKLKSQLEDIKSWKDEVNVDIKTLQDLEPRLKKTEDEIKNIDDTIDGMRNSLKDLDKKQGESSIQIQELRVIVKDTQVEMKEQEKKMTDQSNSDASLLKKQIVDLENKVGISRQKIEEIDGGTQGLLEKLLSVEKDLTDDLDSLKNSKQTFEDGFKAYTTSTDAKTAENIKDFNSKLNNLKEELVSTISVDKVSFNKSLEEFQNYLTEAAKKNEDVSDSNKKALDSLKGEFTAALTTITSGSMSSITSLTEKISSIDTSIENVSKQTFEQSSQLTDLQNSQKESKSILEDLEVKVKENKDRLDGVDDSLDGLQKQLKDFEAAQKAAKDTLEVEIVKLGDVSGRHSQALHTVEMLNDKINNLEEKQPKLKSELDNLQTAIVSHSEKLVQIEEAHSVQVEKSKFIETLDAKITKMDALRQQSEAKAKEENTLNAGKVEKDLVDLRSKINESFKALGVVTPRISDLENNLKATSDSVEDKLKKNVQDTEQNLKKFKEEAQLSFTNLDNQISAIEGKLESCEKDNKNQFNDHEKKLNSILEAHEQHSGILTNMTKTITSIEENLSAYDSKQKAVTENLLVTSEAQLKEFRSKYDSRITDINRRIDEHNDQFDQTELNLVDMKRKFDENNLHTQRDLEDVKKKCCNENELVVMKIKEQKDTLESFFTSLEEKIELIETTQIKEVRQLGYH